MDLGKLLQENPALIGVIGAIVGFLASQAVQIWRDWQTERRAIAREQRADRRALRDAKLARLRAAFEPIVLASMGFQTAASKFLFSPAGDPRERAKEILSQFMTRANEARVQLLLEDDVNDVYDELGRVQRAFSTIEFGIGGRLGGQETATTAEELKQAFADVKDGGETIEKLVKEHLRNVERSPIN